MIDRWKKAIDRDLSFGIFRQDHTSSEGSALAGIRMMVSFDEITIWSSGMTGAVTFPYVGVKHWHLCHRCRHLNSRSRISTNDLSLGNG